MKTTVSTVQKMKDNGEKITMLTAYDYSTAKLFDEAGIDTMLVGDSLGMVMLGYDSTIPVTVDDMIHHGAAVVRGAKDALIVVDMPFLSYHTSVYDAVANAGRIMKETGCTAVKLEGGKNVCPQIEAIVNAQIPVCAHIGLTPQSSNMFGGFRVQGKSEEAAKELIEAAQAVEKAGAFMLVLEGIPEKLAAIITKKVHIPTIGIGASPECDGQVLVYQDMLAMYGNFVPKFVRQFAQVGEVMQGAVKDYINAVKEGTFPGPENTYAISDDVIEKLTELREKEDSPLSKVIYDTMFKNQELAVKLNRPSCQDTGVLQFWVKCGTKFPLIDELEGLLKDAVVKATFEAPLRHNSVETFDEYNTGKNVGKGTPTVFWDIVPNSDKCEIYTYMAGGGCTLPGKAMVLMPGEGYEGVTKFVMDVMTTYGLNACPPLLVGVGVATSVETAALLSKKALMRPIGSHNENERAAKMETLLEDGINAIGLGPQGMGGKYSVMGVNIENTARHPSTIGVAVNVGCWSHRRGHIVFDKDLNYTITTHTGVEL